MAALGVGCALAWLHSFAHSGQVGICQGLSQTPLLTRGVRFLLSSAVYVYTPYSL